jgi:putative ABC transport system substrate-binding protein
MKAFRLPVLAALAFAVLAAQGSAQTPDKVYRVGVLTSTGPLDLASDTGVGLVRGLSRHGYAVGRNLVLESRGAQVRMERLPGLVRELVDGKVDALFTISYPAALAAKEGTSTIPIVIIFGGDPVESGLVRSLARPGGNITGISDVATELSVKRMELLKELVPGLRRVAMLWNANDFGMTLRYRAAATAARAFGLEVQSLGVAEPEAFDSAFAAMTRDKPDAILMVSDALTLLNRKRVFDFAAEHRLPAIYEYKRYAQDGGLMSYGPDQADAAAMAAGLMDRILKGAKPAELPVQQPTKFELAVNLKTAKALGLTIPQSILFRADEVIE